MGKRQSIPSHSPTAQLPGVWIVGIAALPERTAEDRRKAQHDSPLQNVSNIVKNRELLFVVDTFEKCTYNNKITVTVTSLEEAPPSLQVMAMSHHRTTRNEG